MLAAAEHVQLLIHASPQRSFGQHTLDGELDGSLGVLGQQLAQMDALQVADIARVLVVPFIGQFRSGDPHIAGIDDHDMIAEVLMRRIIRLVLTLQAVGDLRCEATQSLARGVDDEPVDSSFVGLGKYGIHGQSRLFWDLAKGAKVYRTARRLTSPALANLAFALDALGTSAHGRGKSAGYII